MGWNYSEVLGLLGVIEKHRALFMDLDLVRGVLGAVRLNKQGWGQCEAEPLELLAERFECLREKLRDHALIADVDVDIKAVKGGGDDESEDNNDNDNTNNLSVM